MASNVPTFNNFKLPTLNNKPSPILSVFTRQNAFEKALLGEMLIEQIIDFESRVPGPLVVHIFLKQVIFMTKQKSLKANLRVHYLMLKCCRKQCTLISLTWAKSQNLTPKCKILNVFWT